MRKLAELWGSRRVPPASAAAAGGLAAAAAVFLLASPVQYGDGTLWSALDAGRGLFEHGRAPRGSDFSFIDRAGGAGDWLHHAALYAAYRSGGFPGLLALRTLLFGAAAWGLWRLLAPARGPWPAGLFGLSMLVLAPRFETADAGSASLAALAGVLWVLELRPRLAWLLPGASALWANLHGAAHPLPLGLAVCAVLGYFLGGDRSRGQGYLAWTGLSAAALFLTPHGHRLVDLPFPAPPAASEAGLAGWAVLPPGALTALTALAGAAAAACAVRHRDAPLRALLMWLGALFLLVRGRHAEAILLSAPLWRASDPLPAGAALRPPLPLLGGLAAAALGFSTLAGSFPGRGGWPLSADGLPRGVASCLKEGAGRVLHPPELGGYLRWTRPPGLLLSPDLLQPTPFLPEDLYASRAAFESAPVLAGVLRDRRPDWIAAPLSARGFPALIAAHPEFAAVCYDDAAALYARRGPGAPRPLLDPDPIGTAAEPGARLRDPALRARVASDLERLRRTGPNTLLRMRLTVELELAEGRPEEARRKARLIVLWFPGAAAGPLLKGEALLRLGQAGSAAKELRKAAAAAKGGDLRRARLGLAKALLADGRSEEAYRSLEPFVRLSPGDSPEELLGLAEAAAGAGRAREARAALEALAFHPLGPDGERLRRRLDVLAAAMGEGGRPRAAAAPRARRRR